MKSLLSVALVVLMSLVVVSGVSYGACDPSKLYTPGDKLDCLLEKITELQNPNLATTLTTSVLIGYGSDLLFCTVVNAGFTDIILEIRFIDINGNVLGGPPFVLKPGNAAGTGIGGSQLSPPSYCQVMVLQGSASYVRANFCVQDGLTSASKVCSEAR